MNADFQIEVVGFGGAQHRQDVAALAAAGMPLPHGYAAVDSRLSSAGSRWVRVCNGDRATISGFALHTSMSRALPGTLIGRIDRLGRRLHEPLLPHLGEILLKAALVVPRLKRLHLRVYDEDGDRRKKMLASIASAGGDLLDHGTRYMRTIVMPLDRVVAREWPSVSKTAQYKLRKFSRMTQAEIRPITDTGYAGRMRQLFSSTFDRSGGTAPSIDMRAAIEDAASDAGSRLVGVFIRDRARPDDLVAFMRAVFHGDHASYEEGATERSEEFRNLPLGYPLMVDLLDWTRSAGGTWFDFGGIPLGEQASSPSLAGITQFKQQFSREELDVAQEAVMLPRPALARVAQAVRSVARLVRR